MGQAPWKVLKNSRRKGRGSHERPASPTARPHRRAARRKLRRIPATLRRPGNRMAAPIEERAILRRAVAISQWKLTRIEVAEKNIAIQEVAAKTQIPLLDRLWQSQCRLTI